MRVIVMIVFKPPAKLPYRRACVGQGIEARIVAFEGAQIGLRHAVGLNCRLSPMRVRRPDDSGSHILSISLAGKVAILKE